MSISLCVSINIIIVLRLNSRSIIPPSFLSLLLPSSPFFSLLPPSPFFFLSFSLSLSPALCLSISSQMGQLLPENVGGTAQAWSGFAMRACQTCIQLWMGASRSFSSQQCSRKKKASWSVCLAMQCWGSSYWCHGSEEPSWNGRLKY